MLDIYAVVCVDTEATAEEKEKNGNGGRLRVRVEFSSKEGVRPYGPQLPPSRTYCLDDNFRKFFLSKRMCILPLSLSVLTLLSSYQRREGGVACTGVCAEVTEYSEGTPGGTCE